MFSQQCQAKGDSKATCLISADSISLQWAEETGRLANKYDCLNKSNVGICFTASGYKQFRAFATLCGMPTTFISDNETDEPTNPSTEGPIMMTPSDTPTDKSQRTDFTVHPTVIPSDDQDETLLKSDQAVLMRLHEQLSHCSFDHLKQMAEQGIISRKLAKVPTPKCPSCLYGKAHRKPWWTHKIDQKSNRQPYQELWSASTNLNPQFRDSSPSQKDNQKSVSIAVLRCLWTTQGTSRTSTCTNT